jgi:O-antigen/teichoic acid export membrane protein
LNNTGLKQRLMRAAGWTVLGHGLSQVIRLGSSLILTRLLAPELYGVMAVGYVVMTGLGMFSDLGLSSGAIRSERGDDPHFLNVSWVVQIARGVVVAIGAMVVALAVLALARAGWLPAHSVYADSQVPPLLAVVSIYAVVSGFESTKVWWARRHLSLAAITKIELITQIATTLFQVAWALIAPSIWTLAGGWIFGGVLKTLMTHWKLPGPPNRFEWDRPLFREIFDFGKWVVLSSAFSFLLTSGDKLLLGGWLDTREMGAYSIAFMLIGALQVAVLKVVGFTVLPALGEVHRERPAEMRSTIYRIRKPLDVVCLVAAGALLVLGPSIVGLLYDKRYEQAGWMLSVLSLTLVSTRLDVLDQSLIAMGRVRLLSVLNALRLVTLYAAIPIGYITFGSVGAVSAVAASALVNATMMLTTQARLHLIDVRRELLAVPLFAGGLAIGWAAKAALHFVR